MGPSASSSILGNRNTRLALRSPDDFQILIGRRSTPKSSEFYTVTERFANVLRTSPPAIVSSKVMLDFAVIPPAPQTYNPIASSDFVAAAESLDIWRRWRDESQGSCRTKLPW